MASWGAISIGSTRPLYTWISASVVRQLAVLDVNTVVIELTLQIRNTNAIRAHHEARRTDALGAVIREDQPSAGVTDALVTNEDKPELGGAPHTHALAVGVVARGTDALLPLVQDEAAARGTGGHWGALHCCVALVSLDADADHGPHRLGVQHSALGVAATGVGEVAGLHALLADAGQLTRALGV